MVLREICCGSAPGADDIHRESGRALPVHCKKARLSASTQSILIGCAAATWKEWRIVPLLTLHKPDDGFAPLSSSSTINLCKLLEQMASRQLRNHLEDKLPPRPCLASLLAAPL